MRNNKICSALMTVPLILALFAGCGSSGAGSGTSSEITTVKTAAQEESADNADAEYELTFFDQGSGNYDFTDRIAEAIQRKTGVKITLVDPTDDTDEKESLMLAYGDYPDMILINRENIGKYESAGAVIDLDRYLDELPNVQKMYGDWLDHMRYTDGGLYYLGNWYGIDDNAVSAFMMRYDYLCEIVGRERADSNEPFTQEEFTDILRQFRELHPEIDGQQAIPFTICTDYGYATALRGMYGLKSYGQEGSSLSYLGRDSGYLKMLLFENELYREGLLDREWIANRKDLFAQKLESGRVFSTSCAYWDVDDVNVDLRNEYGEEAFFAPYKVLGEGISAEETTYAGRSSLGWDAIAVTTNCENVEAALRVIDYLASEEGQYLMMWGIEGEDWDLTDGVHTPREDLMEDLSVSTDNMKQKRAIRRWTWFINNGKGSDGTYFDLLTQYPSEQTKLARARVANAGDLWDTSYYDALTPGTGTKEALIWKNATDIADKAYPRIVNAASEEEAVLLYNNMISDMDNEGLPEAEKVITQNYRERLTLWGESE